jgi:hypothetical protein
MEKRYINFSNAVQAALYNEELAGQISDGCWENARPYGHWRDMSSAIGVAVECGPLGPNFRTKRKYNFNNALLVEVCGERMIAMARKAGAPETYGLKELRKELRAMSKIVNADY